MPITAAPASRRAERKRRLDAEVQRAELTGQVVHSQPEVEWEPGARVSDLGLWRVGARLHLARRGPRDTGHTSQLSNCGSPAGDLEWPFPTSGLRDPRSREITPSRGRRCADTGGTLRAHTAARILSARRAHAPKNVDTLRLLSSPKAVARMTSESGAIRKRHSGSLMCRSPSRALDVFGAGHGASVHRRRNDANVASVGLSTPLASAHEPASPRMTRWRGGAARGEVSVRRAGDAAGCGGRQDLGP